MQSIHQTPLNFFQCLYQTTDITLVSKKKHVFYIREKDPFFSYVRLYSEFLAVNPVNSQTDEKNTENKREINTIGQELQKFIPKSQEEDMNIHTKRNSKSPMKRKTGEESKDARKGV